MTEHARTDAQTESPEGGCLEEWGRPWGMLVRTQVWSQEI